MQQPGHAGTVQGRRHHEEAQVLAQGALGVERQGEAEIGVQRALVKLVEQHRADARQFGVVEDHAGEHALGDDLDPGPSGNLRAEPHAQADRLADALGQRRRHALGRTPRREATRLKKNDPVGRSEPGRVEESEGHAGGLARARRGDEHGGRTARQGFAQGGQSGFDGEGGSARTVRRLGVQGFGGHRERWCSDPQGSASHPASAHVYDDFPILPGERRYSPFSTL